MTDTVTLPRSVVEQALYALQDADTIMEHRQDIELRRSAMTALRTALEQPQGEQEPVAWIENIGGGVSYNPYHEAARKLPDGVRFDLYTSPQPRRQPLSDDKFERIWEFLHDEEGNPPDPHDFARAIERAHKIGGEL